MKSTNKQVLVVGDRVLIRPDTGESKSPAGLYLPPSVLEKQEVRGGMVVEVGPGIRGFIDISRWQPHRIVAITLNVSLNDTVADQA